MSNRIAIGLAFVLAGGAAAADGQSPARAHPEVMTAVTANLAFVDAQLGRTEALAEDAREEKDLARLVCIDERLRGMRRLVGVAKDANADLLASMVGDDAAAMNANATKIAIARARVETLAAQADRCLGALVYRTGDATNVEVREPAGLPAAGSTGTRLGVVHRLERPEERSPMVNPDAAFDPVRPRP